MLLFHVHFDVADVPASEAEFERDGFRVKARFGFVGREHRRFDPSIGWDELAELGVRLRLVELERGAVNVVLMRAKAPDRRLGQVGFTATGEERGDVLARAAACGLKSEPDDVRSFVRLDHRLDLELSDAGRYAYDAAALAELRIESLEVACARPERSAMLARMLLGPEHAASLRFVPGPQQYARLESWTLAGAAAAPILVR